MNQLACRACRKPLTENSGCGVCTSFKRNLVVTGDRPGDSVDLGDLTTEALALARSRLQLLKSWGPVDPRYNPKEAMELLRTISVMADAARKIRKEGAAAVNSMTFQERAELFVGWWSELPPAHREFVKHKLEASIGQLPDLGDAPGDLVS